MSVCFIMIKILLSKRFIMDILLYIGLDYCHRNSIVHRGNEMKKHELVSHFDGV